MDATVTINGTSVAVGTDLSATYTVSATIDDGHDTAFASAEFLAWGPDAEGGPTVELSTPVAAGPPYSISRVQIRGFHRSVERHSGGCAGRPSPKEPSE